MSYDPRVDTSRPHPARVYDWLLGGVDNFPADRAVGEGLPAAARQNARWNRQFMHRAARYVAGRGVRQYLDVGSGIPTEPNLHQVVQGLVPSARVVYADNDPLVLAHSAALLVGTPEGATHYLDVDVRAPGELLDRAGDFLDLGQPVALSLVALLHFLPEGQDPYGVVRTLVSRLAPGSYLVLTHGTADEHPELEETTKDSYRRGAIPLRMRTRHEVERFFNGLDLVAPGLVTANYWYQDGDRVPPQERSGFWAGVARVP
ncbi:SAM-dependent methyltransferase [Streptomyces sp. NPDC088925]|uniref:SAM-dependent methyltransferase n=1 Tax=Streptomyces sp. NPDC088925 TaxID=3365914 RepID=UPI0038141E2E